MEKTDSEHILDGLHLLLFWYFRGLDKIPNFSLVWRAEVYNDLCAIVDTRGLSRRLCFRKIQKGVERLKNRMTEEEKERLEFKALVEFLNKFDNLCEKAEKC
jgi:hypothetical protein